MIRTLTLSDRGSSLVAGVPMSLKVGGGNDDSQVQFVW
jgi:hypothetical protein